MKKLYVILGPTSTGKTQLAIKLAKKYGGVLISADSRQVYKFMDIGTGKVPIGTNAKIEKRDKMWTVDGVDIWGYDLVNPNDYFSAYDYGQFAINKINNLHEQTQNQKKDSNKHGKIFLVGGTGFYIDIVTGRVELDHIKPDFELRNELEQFTATKLNERLMSLNLDVHKKTDGANRTRLIRAIEKELNKNSPSLQNKQTKLMNFQPVYIGLTSPREQLYKRVDNWLETIWKNGLIDEVEWLINNGYKFSQKLNGIIYKDAIDYIKGLQPQNEAVKRAKFGLHAYIRRQQTYFKRNKKITWVDITQENSHKTIENLLQ